MNLKLKGSGNSMVDGFDSDTKQHKKDFIAFTGVGRKAKSSFLDITDNLHPERTLEIQIDNYLDRIVEGL